MNGLDAVVFTAGMGENNPELRERVCRDMSFFGIEIDCELNAKTWRQPNIVELSTPASKVKVYVIPTNEELMIAKDTEELVKKAKFCVRFFHLHKSFFLFSYFYFVNFQ